MIRCGNCQTDFIINETKYQNWLSLCNFLEFLFHEGYIEQVTYDHMIAKLLTFKPFAEDYKEDDKDMGQL